jgi:hypothetical protein
MRVSEKSFKKEKITQITSTKKIYGIINKTTTLASIAVTLLPCLFLSSDIQSYKLNTTQIPKMITNLSCVGKLLEI